MQALCQACVELGGCATALLRSTAPRGFETSFTLETSNAVSILVKRRSKGVLNREYRPHTFHERSIG